MNMLDDGTGNIQAGTIAVIGIGQSLRGDDGAGLAAVRLWNANSQQEHDRPTVRVELAELPGLGLLDLLAGSHIAILVDAVRSGSKCGLIHQFTEDDLIQYSSGSGSAHGWGVAETIALGRQTIPNQLPDQVIFVGIEAGQLDIGERLSPEVERSLPEAALLIEQLVSEALRNA
jgi:hydrogenase maturation protease